jgi:CDP-4-dehydro-6-deoxyglucose reductase
MRPSKTARLLETRDLAPDIRHFVFEIEDSASFNFVPGQFVSLTADLAGAAVTRAYSLAALPRGARFEICLNRVEGGKFSPHLFTLRPGGAVRMTGPWGGFIFRPPVIDSVLVATGTGIVPFRPMVEEILARDRERRFTLIYGARYENRLLYRADFERLAREHANFRFEPVLSRPDPGWTGRTGHVQPHVQEIIGARRDLNVFLCGLKAMVDDMRSKLKEMGFERRQVIYEKYD